MLPVSFIESIANAKGFQQETFEQVHRSGEQVISIRINPAKLITPDQLDLDASLEKIPWTSSGYYLSRRPSFTGDPVFHAGAYYVQESSSMFLEEVLKQSANLSEPLKVLDLCAAPGGKSTLIQAAINDKSLLVSNEVIKTRVNILAENVTKWGAANVIVTNNDPKDFQRLPDFFDVVVVDAPCSGSGLFRKDSTAINEWSEQNVALCSQRQRRILADILPSLKEGGVMIYSTCSYSIAEDEAIADWLKEAFELESIRLKLDDQWGIVETTSPEHNAYGYRFYPDQLKGEGFFIAAFRKPGAGTPGHVKYKTRSEKLVVREMETVAPYLKEPQNFFCIKQKDEVIAIPGYLEQDLAAVQSCLYIKKAGVKLGTIIRNELIPDHELAISTIVHPGLPAVETDRETALQYLRKQDMSLHSEVRGWALITHQQFPLGWVKILPNRVNNYYPKDWRILNK